MRIGTLELKRDIPAIMGIVNVTPDSFFDGGRWFSASKAVEHALRLAEEGADIIDIGGESTRPGAESVAEAEEISRVLPVIEGIRRESDIPISVDTTKASVASAAVEAGADMINDISAGRFDREMLEAAARLRVPICLMHIKGTPKTMQLAPSYDDLISEITSYLKSAIETAIVAGVRRDRILIDPGIGFGKSVDDNFEIIRRMRHLLKLETPLLVGTSRKSFIGKALNEEVDRRLEGTLATIAACVDGGASILRLHDVAEARRFLTVFLSCR